MLFCYSNRMFCGMQKGYLEVHDDPVAVVNWEESPHGST